LTNFLDNKCLLLLVLMYKHLKGAASMKKTNSIIIFLLCFVLLLSACDNTESPVQSTTGSGENVLDVYYLASDPAAAFIVQGYRPNDSGVKLNAVAFQSAEEMDLRISTEASSDKSADVVLFSSVTALDTAKMAVNNAFLDLTPYLSADESFDAANYYPILDAGKASEKQVLIPLRFQLQHLLTTQEKLAAGGITLKEGYTYSELMNALTANAASCSEDQSAMTSHLEKMPGNILYDALRLSNVPIADMTGKTLSVSEDTFREYAEYIQMACGQMVKSSQILSLYSRDFIGGVSKLTTILAKDSLPQQMRYYQALYDQGLGEKIQLLTFPNYGESNALTADVTLYAAALQSADQPQAAYDFIRYAMDTTIGQITNDLPVSRKAVAALLDELCANPGKNINIGSMYVQIPVMSEELRNSCEGILSRITSGNIQNSAIASIFDESMQGYLLGQSTFEECYKTFQNRMNLYLYE